MAGYNHIVLMGNLCRDPELKYTAANTPVCNFTIAVNRKWRDAGGETKEEVLFIGCDAFGRTGELVNQYLRKGSPCLVEGRLRLQQWDGKDGAKKSRHSILVESVQFLGGPSGNGNGSNNGDSAGSSRPSGPPSKRPAPATPGTTKGRRSAAEPQPEGEYSPDEDGSDLPF